MKRLRQPGMWSVVSLLVGAIVVGTVLLSSPPSSAGGSGQSWAKLDMDGNLLRPEGYRDSWVFVGTPLTLNDMNDGNAPFPEFHNVYIDPDSYSHFKKPGQFRVE